jgi:hypothetical protein
MVARGNSRNNRIPTEKGRRRAIDRAAGLVLAAAFAAAVSPGRAVADGREDEGDGDRHRACSATARAALHACGSQSRDAYWTAIAICTNVSDDEERRECFAEARQERQEADRFCGEQFSARRRLCGKLGEGRYDPDFDPEAFEEDFVLLSARNPYFPLSIGNRWEYGGSESVTVEVLSRTKRIEGVPCVVVRDRVKEDGRVTEDTEDWFAQARDGSVWYCGEQVREFETFAGDVPATPELVGTDGSFKAGRNGDKPGIIFLASPAVGDLYRQEFSIGNAEDVAEVLSISYSFGEDPELDKLVPPALARLLCAGDCIVTAEGAPLEPDVLERKYYAAGIGLFLTTSPGTGERVQLIGCNVDARCAALPAAKR